MNKITIANKSIIKTIPPNGFYIGRPSPLGNPYPVKSSSIVRGVTYPIDESLKRYRNWLYRQVLLKDERVLRELNKIREMLKASDVVLVCWCVDKAGEGKCHGFSIKSCINWMESLEQ